MSKTIMQIVSHLKLFVCAILPLALTACGQNHAVPVENLTQSPPVSSINSVTKSVVVLLPLQGNFAKAGQMVRDGYMTAYKQANNSKIKVTVFDMESYASPSLAYQAATAEQPDLIVGPLTKAAVNDLSLQVTLPVATLALNQADPNSVAPINLFQFSLNPQANAVDAAVAMLKAGYHKAIVIAPTGDWGQGIAASFGQAWIAGEGEILDSLDYRSTDNFSDAIAQLAKTHNAQELQGAAIFLVASAKNAAATLPTIKAALPNLPIYSLPIIFDGSNQAQLDGVNFEVSPWTQDSQSAEKQDLQKQYPTATAEDLKLYAFGQDAYRLTAYYVQNGGFAGLTLQANSGYLTIDTNGVINRELKWATIANGQLQIKVNKGPDVPTAASITQTAA